MIKINKYGFVKQISCCWQKGPINGTVQLQVTKLPFAEHFPLLPHGFGKQAKKKIINQFTLK